MDAFMDHLLILETFDKVSKAISNIDGAVVNDIYAISFWKDNIDDDPRKPIITVGYNTMAQWEACTPKSTWVPGQGWASDSDEAKWNFAFWLQNELLIIGENDPKFDAWIKQLPYYYTDEENDKDFERTFPLHDKIQGEFIKIIIPVAQQLHAKGIIKSKFGREIPIIIHELQYYDLPLSWTQQANPPGLIVDFVNWVKGL
jgi:hypothetical protein